MKALYGIGLALVLAQTACGKYHRVSQEGEASRFKGYWLEKTEAEELRRTGKLESLCAQIKKDGIAYNLRKIDEKGNEFLVLNQGVDAAGTLTASDVQKISTINSAGQLKLEPDFKKQLSQNTAIMARMEGDLLIETTSSGKGSLSIYYLRSNATEAAQYFAAQKACTAAQQAK